MRLLAVDGNSIVNRVPRIYIKDGKIENVMYKL